MYRELNPEDAYNPNEVPNITRTHTQTPCVKMQQRGVIPNREEVEQVKVRKKTNKSKNK